MKRFDDWPERLAQFLEERCAMPFEWGSNDCALFVCDAVMAMTGTDLAAGWRGNYTSALEAARAMKNVAGGGLAEVADQVAAAHNLEPIAPLFAQRGDVALLETDSGPTLAIVGMNGEALAPGPEKASAYPLRDYAIRAWRV